MYGKSGQAYSVCNGLQLKAKVVPVDLEFSGHGRDSTGKGGY